MKDLLKTMLFLALLFACTFIILKITGIISIESIKDFLISLHTSYRALIATVIIALLFADLFIAVPTLTISLLAGYFLGWIPGVVAVALGFYSAGITGYLISRRFGWGLLERIYRDEARLYDIQNAFTRLGPIMLILCRATPILPEVSSCMAGATRMPFPRYLLLYSIGSIPYAFLVTYAGSISTLENPGPAIVTAFTISLVLWFSLYVFTRQTNKADTV